MLSLTSQLPLTRRALLGRTSLGLGALAWAALARGEDLGAAAGSAPFGGLAELPHHRPRAKRVIFLTMSGGPSQVDLFDPKPALTKHQKEEIPASIVGMQRLTTMTSDQKSKPL